MARAAAGGAVAMAVVARVPVVARVAVPILAVLLVARVAAPGLARLVAAAVLLALLVAAAHGALVLLAALRGVAGGIARARLGVRLAVVALGRALVLLAALRRGLVLVAVDLRALVALADLLAVLHAALLDGHVAGLRQLRHLRRLHVDLCASHLRERNCNGAR